MRAIRSLCYVIQCVQWRQRNGWVAVAGRARSKEFFSTDNFLYNKRVSNRERGRERLNLRQAEPVYDRFKKQRLEEITLARPCSWNQPRYILPPPPRDVHLWIPWTRPCDRFGDNHVLPLPPPPRQKARRCYVPLATVLNANWKSAAYDLATRETPAITP